MNQEKNYNTSRKKIRLRKSRIAAVLMVIAILGITGFQAYWLKDNYGREKQNLDLKTRVAFRETILKLQSTKLKLDNFVVRFDSTHVMGNVKRLGGRKSAVRKPGNLRREPIISILNLIEQKVRDSMMVDSNRNKIKLNHKRDSVQFLFIDSARSVTRTTVEISKNAGKRIEDTQIYKADLEFSSNLPPPFPPPTGEGQDIPGSPVVRILYGLDSLSAKDSVKVSEVKTAFGVRLKEEGLDVGYNVERLDNPTPGAVTVGFSHPVHFEYSLNNTLAYMLGKLKLPLLFSILLVGITIVSFILLYKNMIRQQRLADLKNEFISNITHELKTPIATVGVAIEALKSFNAMDDPKRTQEYLDISQNELQRLNLLVDKVLKLSMFEKKEVDLKFEWLDIKDVVDEVITSMRLQLEKNNANISINTSGDTHLEGDRLHLLSVIFNIIDNALKYGNSTPEIKINIDGNNENVELRISDNGQGIPAEYKDKIFEKFFRVPQGNTHNAKGYGLGLSYAAHVINKHNGIIWVEDVPTGGTSFIITLPKAKKSA